MLIETLTLTPLVYFTMGLLCALHNVYRGIEIGLYGKRRKASVSAEQWAEEKNSLPDRILWMQLIRAAPVVMLLWPMYVVLECIYD